jgi:large subunit ribosomal protein L18
MPFKRRYEKKTDYKKRLGLLKSGKPRLVVRRSNKHLKIQIVKYEPEGDKTLASATTHDLKKLGWKYSTSNTSASYLTGLLIAKRAKKKKIKQVVLDFGPQISIKGSRLYAAVKGAVDGGLDLPCSKDVFPSEDRIKGKPVANYWKEKTDTYKVQFSKVKPENIVKDFEKLKEKIMD